MGLLIWIAVWVLLSFTPAWAGTPGNINSDTQVDLADAVLALQVACGISATVNSDGDVNGDGLIGIAEAIQEFRIHGSPPPPDSAGDVNH